MDHLRRKVFKKVKPKQLKGQFITGHMLIELAEAYTESLNKGGIPVIETAWEYMQSNEIEKYKSWYWGRSERLIPKIIIKQPKGYKLSKRNNTLETVHPGTKWNFDLRTWPRTLLTKLEYLWVYIDT